MSLDAQEEKQSLSRDEESCTESLHRKSCRDDDDDEATPAETTALHERRLALATLTGFLLLVLALAHHPTAEPSAFPTGNDSLRASSSQWSKETSNSSAFEEPDDSIDTASSFDGKSTIPWSNSSMHSSLDTLEQSQSSHDAGLVSQYAESSEEDVLNENDSELHDSTPSEQTAGSDDLEDDQNLPVTSASSPSETEEYSSADHQTVDEEEDAEGQESSPDPIEESSSDDSSDETARSSKQPSAIQEVLSAEDEMEGRMEAQDNGN
eukprot:scaffold24410_cov108-Cylindrotheca_fusiformis.AAC.3